MADEQQTKIDTGQLRAIVEQSVETALSKKLEDRPTRAEVRNMISENVDASITRLESRLSAARQQEMNSFREMWGTNLAALNKSIDRLIAHSEAERKQLRKDIEDNEGRIGDMGKTIAHLGETQVMMMTTVNNLNGAVFGVVSGDGPESLFAMARATQIALQELSQKVDARLIPMECWIATRSAIEQQAKSIGRFIFTTWQGRVVLAIGVVLLFKALSLDYWAEHFFEALTAGGH